MVRRRPCPKQHKCWDQDLRSWLKKEKFIELAGQPAQVKVGHDNFTKLQSELNNSCSERLWSLP